MPLARERSGRGYLEVGSVVGNHRHVPLAVICAILDAVGIARMEGDRTEILRMQAGVRAWVLRAAGGSGRGLHEISPPVLLSLLCAAAFSPLIAVGAGITGAALLRVSGCCPRSAAAP